MTQCKHCITALDMSGLFLFGFVSGLPSEYPRYPDSDAPPSSHNIILETGYFLDESEYHRFKALDLDTGPID